MNGQHGADARARGADADDNNVLTRSQRTYPLPIQIPEHGEAPRQPGELAKARPAPRTGNRVGTALEPLEERLRKARSVIATAPDINDEKLATMFRLGPAEIRKARGL